MDGSDDIEQDQLEDLKRILFILHLYTNRSAFRGISGFETICTKISIAFLRYGDAIPIERAYFDAGIYCKVGIVSFAILK
jgi:intraflagellar transport protein 172